MWQRAEGRLLSFREFCELLVDPKYSVWLEPLIGFYLGSGRGEHIPQVHLLLEALEDLGNFIDGHVGGVHSVASRAAAEQAIRTRYAQLQGRDNQELSKPQR